MNATHSSQSSQSSHQLSRSMFFRNHNIVSVLAWNNVSTMCFYTLLGFTMALLNRKPFFKKLLNRCCISDIRIRCTKRSAFQLWKWPVYQLYWSKDSYFHWLTFWHSWDLISRPDMLICKFTKVPWEAL